MDKLRSVLLRYKDMLLYLVFGVLTTAVNYLVYYPLYNLLGISAAVSNMAAWIVAVLFAFATNKPFVFKSNDWSLKTLWTEFYKFLLCRVGSGVLETLFLLVTVDILKLGGNIMKLIISVVVVVLNYIASRLFVFKK